MCGHKSRVLLATARCPGEPREVSIQPPGTSLILLGPRQLKLEGLPVSVEDEVDEQTFPF